MGETFISIDNLFKVFTSKAEDLTVLRGTSFQIERGEIVCLLGTSGSGKTTTLNLLAGLDKPTSGQILYGGEDINKWDTADLYDYRLREIGFIFQDFHLMEHLTALENVMVPLLLMKKEEGEAKEKALELINKVGLRAKAMNHPEELSSGEKQRVCVARAVANSPSILIADEPTGTLDSKTGDVIMNLLLDLSKKNNMTVIYTTHDPYLARMATRLLIVQKGVISEAEITNIEEVDYENIISEYKQERDEK